MAGSSGLSYQRVLVDWDNSLKKWLRDGKLGKVVPALVQRKAVPKRLGKAIQKKADIDLLLGWLKESSFENFLAFLEVVGSVCEDEGQRDLMKSVSGSLSKMSILPGSASEEVVKRFIAAAHAETQPKMTGLGYDVSAPHFTDIAHTPPQTSISGIAVRTDAAQSPTLEDLPVQSESHERHTVDPPCPIPSTDDSTRDTASQDVMRPDQSLESGLQGQPVKGSIAIPSSSSQVESLTVSTLQSETSSIALTREPMSGLPQVSCEAPTPPPPPGYIGCPRETFTRAGGTLYSPEYGITVTIPAHSLPLFVGTFMLSAYVYLQGPFTLSEGTELCTPVVWFELVPSFTFTGDVTIKIAHSAFIPPNADLNQLSLWRAPDLQGPIYSLSQKVEADFSDGYHVIAQVKHFSPYGSTVPVSTDRKKRRSWSRRVSHSDSRPINHSQPNSSPTAMLMRRARQRNLKRLQSGSHGSSVESQSSVDSDDLSSDQVPMSAGYSNISPTQPEQALATDERMDCQPSHQSDCRLVEVQNPGCSDCPFPTTVCTNQFCMSKCVPRDRSTPPWEAAFYISYHNPAGVTAIRLAAESKFGPSCDVSWPPRKFQFTEDKLLKFHPSDWKESGWNVFTTDGNQLEKDEVVTLLCVSPKVYPPHVTYAVRGHSPLTDLKCAVDVLGAQARGILQYVLTSTRPPNPTGARTITVDVNLYPLEGEVVQHLSKSTSCQAIPADFILDTQLPNHQKLLAELSLQLNGPRNLANLLQVDDYQLERILADYHGNEAEQVYHVLETWSSRKSPQPTLRGLLHTLKVAGVEGIQLVSRGEQFGDAFEGLPIPVSDQTFLLNMREKLQRRWKFVARLLGMAEATVERIAHDNLLNLQEQSYQMLVEWIRFHGDGATRGALGNALSTVHAHDPASVVDTCLFNSHTQ